MAKPKDALAGWNRDTLADGLHVYDFVGKLGWADEALRADFE